MTSVFDTVRRALRRARLRLKSFAYSRSARDRWQQPDRVIAALAVREGDRVADLGAGPGYFTFRLARGVGPGGQVYAVDTDPDMSSMIAETAAHDDVRNVVVVEATPDDPMLPEPVDLVLMVNAFHHLPELTTYLTTLSKYLRPGGRIAIIETLPRWFTFGHATTPEAIAVAMGNAGYTRAARHDFLSPQSFQIFERTT
jgi:ubiquinone/menaquinone biosynthesis C-methylase UbiE